MRLQKHFEHPKQSFQITLRSSGLFKTECSAEMTFHLSASSAQLKNVPGTCAVKCLWQIPCVEQEVHCTFIVMVIGIEQCFSLNMRLFDFFLSGY